MKIFFKYTLLLFCVSAIEEVIGKVFPDKIIARGTVLSLLAAPILEELFKYWAVCKDTSFPNNPFKRALLIAVVFVFWENLFVIIYCVQNDISSTTVWTQIFFIRCASSLMHISTVSLFYFYYKSGKKAYFILPFIIHFLYNFSVVDIAKVINLIIT